MQFITSRSEALDKLNKYLESDISNYNAKRNFDFGVADRRNVSCLSPYITHRLITEYETTKLVLKKYPFQKVDKFIQEIFWRVYWKGWLELRPKVWTDFIEDLKTIKENENYLKAVNGETEIECFNDWVKELKLTLPCNGLNIPKRASRLPNAPRDYRNGIHRGIDFFANWGTEVKAVAKGFIVRADKYYKEYPPNFREQMLLSSERAGHTPSDIFNSVLLGKAIIIDHGFDLIPGFRTISIYAHLSSIDKNITPGSAVVSGQVLGKTGNSGTKESTLGTKKESHLHWEMILQKDNNEIYLGKNMNYDNLYPMLKNIFN